MSTTSKKRKRLVFPKGPSEPCISEAALVPPAIAATILVVNLDEDAEGHSSPVAKVLAAASQPATPPTTSNTPVSRLSAPLNQNSRWCRGHDHDESDSIYCGSSSLVGHRFSQDI